MTAVYDFRLIDPVAGTDLGSLPITLTEPITRVLNGCGQLSGSLPLYHPMAAQSMLDGAREITVMRNGTPIWNGPITLEPEANLRTQTVSIVAREASWYLQKRTLEEDRTYTTTDVYPLIRDDLVPYMTSKVSTTGDGFTPAGSSLNASLPRFSVSPAGNSGTTVDRTYSGTARHFISDILNDLIADPTFGLDYKMAYTGTTSLCGQVLTLGSPALGVSRTQTVTENNVFDFTKSEDRERAGNRVHVVYQGGAYTLQNKSDIVTNNDLLLEAVVDRSDTSDVTVVHSTAAGLRLAAYPPVTTHLISSLPGWVPPAGEDTLDYGWCDLGDTIFLNIGTTTVLHSVGHRRVIEIDIMPPTDAGPEQFMPLISLPIDTVT